MINALVALLQLALVAGKLEGSIDWSWGWVMSPTWASLLLGGLVLAVILVSAHRAH